VRRRAALALVAGLLAVGCGGGGASSPTTNPPGASGSAPLVVLASDDFDALVLAAPRPCLVEFHSPT
jgi:ABC-type glycerol-3-phosphate transport system substrate-binding protein